MPKTFVFCYEADAPRGGFSDLRHVLETDNAPAISVVDVQGYLLPAVIVDISRLQRRHRCGCIDALHLDKRARPVRAERWALVEQGRPAVAGLLRAEVEPGWVYERREFGESLLALPRSLA